MEQFAELDNSQNVSNPLNYLKKNTTIFNNNNNIENTLENDVYDIHQSKRIAEQFDISDMNIGDISNSNENETDNNTTYFQNAIQRAKFRMQKLNNSNTTDKNSILKEINNNGNNNNENLTIKDKTEIEEKENNNEITKEEESDDADDDDDIIKSSKHHNVIIEEDKPVDEHIILETQIITNSKVDNELEDDDDEIIKPTQKHKTAINLDDDDNDDNDNKDTDAKADVSTPKPNLNSLFVDEYEDEDDNIPSEDELASKIENYSNMTREQRFLARKLERSKLRNQQRNTEKSFDDNLLTNKKLVKLRERKPIIDQRKDERNKKQELIRQNELIKLAIKQDPVIEPTKFSKKKLLGELKLDSDSDNDDDDNNNDKNSMGFMNSENDNKTPPTSPQKEEKKIIIQNLVRSKSRHSDKLVDLGSASDSDNLDDQSDNDFNEIDSSINKKAKMLDLKLFFSKKKKSKLEKKQKSTLSDKIRKFNAKQLKGKIPSKSNDSNHNENNLTDDILAKMLLEEQIKNSKSRKKSLQEEKRRKREKELLRNGQFPSHDDDDPEYSEYSSDYEISSDEEGTGENLDIEIPSRQIQGIDNEDLDENIKMTDQLDDKNTLTQKDNFKLTQRDAFKDFNLSFSQLYDKTSTQTQNDTPVVENGLTDFEKFQKLKKGTNHNQSTILETQETEDSAIEKSKLLNETSFLKNQLRNEEEFENNNKNELTDENQDFIQLKDMLDSQNLVLETQADNVSMSTQKLDAPLSLLSTQLLSVDNEIVQSTQQIQGSFKNEENKSGLKLDKEEGDANDYDDDDDEKIKIGRKSKIQENDEDLKGDEEEIDEEESEEMRHKRAEMIRLAKRKERELRRQKEREFKAKGLGEIMENEAVESDDEYQGIGGLDKDLSDEENSEDEKLIDDASNIQIDENEMRRIQLENELKEDKEKVSKTYKDVKTHKLAERRAKDGVYAVDLSDDDDENDQLLKWREFIRKRKLKEREEFLEKNQVKIADNDPKKPFFDAMTVHLPSHISIYKDSFSNSPSEINSDDDQNNENSKPPFKKFKSNKYKSFEDDDDIRFSSFRDQELEKLREDVLSDNDNDDDNDGTKELKRLKKKTNIKLNRKLRASQIPIPRVYKVQDDDEFDGLESISLLSNKSNSITSSFKKATEKKVKISANTGNIIRDVNVTTSAKTVTNSRAAVTKLASSETLGSTVLNNKKIIKGSGLDRLDKILAKSRKIGFKKAGKTH